MSRFVLVLPLTRLAVDDGFSLSAWPLHLTIVSNFETALTADEVGARLADASAGYEPVTASIGEDALFGRQHTVRVSLVEPTPQLAALHETLVTAMEGEGVRFDDPDFLHEGYRPHITATKRERVNRSDSFRLPWLALVDMAPAGDSRHRRVVWTGELGVEPVGRPAVDTLH